LHSTNERDAGNEQGDFNFIRALSGWIPESINMGDSESDWSTLCKWHIKPTPPAESQSNKQSARERTVGTPAAAPKALANVPAPSASPVTSKDQPIVLMMALSDDTTGGSPLYFRVTDFKGEDMEDEAMLRIVSFVGCQWLYVLIFKYR
jgi:hypothetical protein